MSDRKLVIDNPIEMVATFSMLAALTMMALFATFVFARADALLGACITGTFFALFAYLWGRSFYNLVRAVNDARDQP